MNSRQKPKCNSYPPNSTRKYTYESLLEKTFGMSHKMDSNSNPKKIYTTKVIDYLIDGHVVARKGSYN